MGNKLAAKNRAAAAASAGSAAAPAPRRLRVLCLHGWRTSGDILEFQTGAMQGNTELDYEFVTAPHAATGPPDDGIATIYAGFPYFEWFLREDVAAGPGVETAAAEVERAERAKGLAESLELLQRVLREASPPFDGVLGFSQGACMAARLAHLSEQGALQAPSPRFVILIGGVPPKDLAEEEPRVELRTPSLHIHGTSDPLLPYSQRLLAMFADSPRRTLLQHTEGHNIPSIRTGLYPKVRLSDCLSAALAR